MSRAAQREEMDRLAVEAVRRYERKGLADLVELSRKRGYAEVRSEGDYEIAVTCLLDDPKSNDAVRIVAVVNRDGLLSFMFPRTKSTVVEKVTLTETELRQQMLDEAKDSGGRFRRAVRAMVADIGVVSLLGTCM